MFVVWAASGVSAPTHHAAYVGEGFVRKGGGGTCWVVGLCDPSVFSVPSVANTWNGSCEAHAARTCAERLSGAPCRARGSPADSGARHEPCCQRLATMIRTLRSFRLLLLGLVAACASPAPAPVPPTPSGAAATATSVDAASVAETAITPASVADQIGFLASDEMRGRDTPSPELERAASYLAEQFQALGLEPAGDPGDFLQWWPFRRMVLSAAESEAVLTEDGEVRRWVYGDEYFAIPGPDTRMEGSPMYAPSPAALAGGLPSEASGRPLAVSLPDGLSEDFPMVLQGAMQVGSTGIILLMDEETDASAVNQTAAALEGGAAGELPLPIIGLRHDVGQELLRSAGVSPGGGRDPPQALDGISVSIRSVFEQSEEQVPNVVARLPGADPELAETSIVLTAHYDHVGVGPADETGDSIYSGADDNASGTSALLQVAQAFAALPEPPARSVVFLAVSGEEKGLLGSEYYVNNPTVPLEGIVANLNMDMVGRNAPDTVYAIGDEYTELGDWVREIARDNPELGLVVASDPDPSEQVFLRSDQFSFVQHRIPALFLTTWLHDDYHAPSDTPDKVDMDKVARVARLAFLLSYRVTNSPEAPDWTPAGRQLLQSMSQAQSR